MTTFKQFVVAEPKTEPKTDSKTDSKTDWQCHVVLINGKLKSVDCKKGNPPPKGKPPPNKRIALPLPVVTTKGVRGAGRESKEEEVPTGLAIQDDPVYLPYLKKLQIGMPLLAVKQMMTKDGLDPNVLDMDRKKPPLIKGPQYAKGPAIQDDPVYLPYLKKLQIGMPLLAVKQMMTKDGLDPNVLDMDRKKPPLITNEAPAPTEIVIPRQFILEGNKLNREGTVYENLDDLECCKFDDIENELNPKKNKKKNKKKKTKKKSAPKTSNRQTFFNFGDPNDNWALQINRFANQYSNSEKFKSLFIRFDISQLIDDVTSKALTAKFKILEDLIQQYESKTETEIVKKNQSEEAKKKQSDEITKQDRNKDHVFSLVSQLSEIDLRTERFNYLVFKIYFENEQPVLLDRVESVTKAAKSVLESVELSKLLGIVVNAVNAGRQQYAMKNGGRTPLVTGVPTFSVMSLFIVRSQLLSIFIARKMLTSNVDVIKRITDNIEIKDLYGADSIDINAIMSDFKILKTESKINFQRKLIFKIYSEKSKQKLEHMEKEVVKMNNIIKAVEKKYAIVPTKVEGTLNQVSTFIFQWNGLVRKAKEEVKLLQNTDGETKKNDNKTFFSQKIKDRRSSMSGD